MDDGSRTGKAAGVDNFNEISELAELHMTCVELRLTIIIIHCSLLFASSTAGFFLFG
jgi:cytochrome b